MQQSIIGFSQDDLGLWIATLACGHRQHLHHDPPWQLRPWTLTPQGRSGHFGSALDCPLCDHESAPTKA